MRRTVALLVAVVLSGVLSGCGVTPPSASGSAAGQPADPAIAIHPDVARPGDELAMQFPDDTGVRGVAFTLDGWDGSGWKPLFHLTSDGQSAHREPAWWRVGEEVGERVGEQGAGWEDAGVSGTGPDHVVVPPEAPAGDYRVCTADAREQLCGLLTIEE
jgi:hypothetical protein